MATPRSPYDGQPYYCTFCGSGLGEYYACEDVRCEMESAETAQARQKRKTEAAPPPQQTRGTR